MKQINIKQSKSYLANVRVNHAEVSKTIKWSSKANTTNSHAKQINIKQSKVLSSICESESCWSEQVIKWSSKAIKHVKIADQTSKQIESPCLKKRYPIIDQLNATFSLTSVQAWSSKSPVESPICGPAFFTCVPTRLARLAFYLWKINFRKVGVATYFIFIFEGKIKQEIKP